jgi:hypothetical protein
MDTLTTLFRTSVRWNTAGAIGYQSLLLAHQAALYKIMSSAQYGAMSVLLSFIYLGAVIADGGLDATLSTFFGELTRERFTFKKFLLPHWVSVFLVATTLALIFGLVHEHFFTTVPLSPFVIVSASLILIAESFRRSLRMTLQLAFKAKIVTLLDIGTMLIYLTFVWGSYFSGTLFNGTPLGESPLSETPLSLELLMGALAFCSVVCSLMMGILVGIWQRKLSDTGSTQKSDHEVSQHEVSQNILLKKGSLQKRLIFGRLINGGNTLTHQLFSGNVLVPLVSMSSGLGDAGLIKLASYVAHGLVTIVRKIVGFSGSALLAALKNAPWTAKRPAFWELSRTLYTTLFFSIIAMTSMSSHLVAQEVISNEQSSILLLVILLIVSEGLCISYETLFIIEEKTLYAIALNSTTGLVAGLLILCAPTLSLVTLLSLILCVRLALFGAMAFVASHLWQLYPLLPSVSGKFLTRTSLLAGLAYLCGSPLALLLAK